MMMILWDKDSVLVRHVHVPIPKLLGFGYDFGFWGLGFGVGFGFCGFGFWSVLGLVLGFGFWVFYSF